MEPVYRSWLDYQARLHAVSAVSYAEDYGDLPCRTVAGECKTDGAASAVVSHIISELCGEGARKTLDTSREIPQRSGGGVNLCSACKSIVSGGDFHLQQIVIVPDMLNSEEGLFHA